MITLLCALLAVTPGPGWSWPIPVTEEPNTIQPNQFIAIDPSGRFHLMWEEYREEPRIGYKVFLVDGTTVVPDTMISNDTWSAYLHQMAFSGDSLFGFWRQGSSPVYYCIRSLSDGSEISPATWVLTEGTQHRQIRASADSLGRLHVLRDIGNDVYYARWTPVAPSGFHEDYCWKIEGAYVSGVILVDGDRVHIVVGEYTNQSLSYLQCDLDGKVTIPLEDFTPGQQQFYDTKWPDLSLDSEGNLMVVDATVLPEEYSNLTLWKIDKDTGQILISAKALFVCDQWDSVAGSQFVFVAAPGNELFYLVWADYFTAKKLWFTAFDAEGNLLMQPYMAYDYEDEDPQDVRNPEGVVDSEGNLYLIYSAGWTEPVFGRYPTFGWFDHNYLPQGVGGEAPSAGQNAFALSPSCNPFSSSVTLTCSGPSLPGQLMVYDITGRLIQSLSDRQGSCFIWDGRDGSGGQVPTGTYIIQGAVDGQVSSIRLVKL